MVTGEPKVSHSHPTPDTKTHREIYAKQSISETHILYKKISETHNSNNYLPTLAEKRCKKRKKKTPNKQKRNHLNPDEITRTYQACPSEIKKYLTRSNINRKLVTVLR